MSRGIADPEGFTTSTTYEVWWQQPAGNWRKIGRTFRTKREAEAAKREARNESSYTKKLKWRVYRVRKAINREWEE